MNWLFFIFIYLFVTVVYNVFFHPLRKFPGPFVAKWTGLWGFYHNLYGNRAHRIRDAHRKYGSVVRVAPNLLSFSDASVVRDIYNSKTFVKAEGFYRAKRIFHEDHLMSYRDPVKHHERRKLLSIGFSQSALSDFEPAIREKIDTMLEHWRVMGARGDVIDIYPWAHMLGFDTIYHLMFGIDPGSLKKGRESDLMPWLRSWRPTFNYKELFPFLEKWGPRVPGSVGKKFRNVQAWKEYSVEVIRQTRKDSTKTIFLSRVLEGEDKSLGRPLTDSELAEECMGGMFGGSGTTANTFVYIVWNCLRNPAVIDRLRCELREAFPDPTIIDSVTCTRLPFLNAVIHETLRLNPTIIAMLPRTATSDTVLNGIPIKKGTNVGVQNFTIHRNEDYFPNPDAFVPERWLDGTADSTAYIPFSVGPRKCIASNLAELELRLVTATFFRRFHATIDPSMGEVDMQLYDGFSASPKSGKLRLRVTEEMQ